MTTISNVVLKPSTVSERAATERVLSSHGFDYEGPGEWFEVYEELTPQNWAEILEEIEQETAIIKLD